MSNDLAIIHVKFIKIMQVMSFLVIIVLSKNVKSLCLLVESHEIPMHFLRLKSEKKSPHVVSVNSHNISTVFMLKSSQLLSFLP